MAQWLPFSTNEALVFLPSEPGCDPKILLSTSPIGFNVARDKNYSADVYSPNFSPLGFSATVCIAQVRKHLLSPCSGSHNAEVKSRLTDALMEVRKLHAEQIHSVILPYVSNALKGNLKKEVSMGPRTTRTSVEWRLPQ